jgi:ubiquinone/menaquinone biosynthesis C-methylase UbiE
MPVDTNLEKKGMIYQRDQYAKGGLGVRYWDYRDKVALNYVVGDRIVDIGCGEGITLEKLVRLYPDRQIVGIDSEPENIEICQKQGLPVQYGTVFDLPFETNAIDCALFFEVIEHLDEPEKALAEINRVLKPTGRLIIVFPNDRMFIISRLLTGMIREAFYDAGHVMQWTPSIIRKALKAEGFSSVATRNLPFLFWPISLHHVSVAEKRPDGH